MKEVLEAVSLAGFEKKKYNSCVLILSDEPTGSLDHANKMKVVDLIKEVQNEGKISSSYHS
jgi:putative ABC transport system ATP-binding protein